MFSLFSLCSFLHASHDFPVIETITKLIDATILEGSSLYTNGAFQHAFKKNPVLTLSKQPIKINGMKVMPTSQLVCVFDDPPTVANKDEIKIEISKPIDARVNILDMASEMIKLDLGEIRIAPNGYITKYNRDNTLGSLEVGGCYTFYSLYHPYIPGLRSGSTVHIMKEAEPLEINTKLILDSQIKAKVMDRETFVKLNRATLLRANQRAVAIAAKYKGKKEEQELAENVEVDETIPEERIKMTTVESKVEITGKRPLMIYMALGMMATMIVVNVSVYLILKSSSFNESTKGSNSGSIKESTSGK